MNYRWMNLKEGIKLHTIKTDKFKTNIIAIFITVPLTRENVTKDSLIDLILHRGSNNFKTQEEINKRLEELYGASFDYGIEKSGDNHVLKFYIESVNDKFLDANENIFENSVKVLSDIVFNPLKDNDGFCQEYFESEKEKLVQIIKSKIDDKNTYSLYRCIEEMYKNKVFGLYKYGYDKDVSYIQNTDLYERYKQIIKEGKIDIFISGDIDEKEINIVKENENIRNLSDRIAKYNIQDGKNDLDNIDEIKEVVESMKVTQGKLVMGLNIKQNNENTPFVALMYNAILGGTANSKLFQNVREKMSLAYTAGSNLLKAKNNIFIRCGIDINNYEKVVDTIKEQLKGMRDGNFSEEDIENAKKSIISTIKKVPDEQDTEITYYLGQELAHTKTNLLEYERNIRLVNKDDIINLAKRVNINTIYFLKN